MNGRRYESIRLMLLNVAALERHLVFFLRMSGVVVLSVLVSVGVFGGVCTPGIGICAACRVFLQLHYRLRSPRE